MLKLETEGFKSDLHALVDIALAQDSDAKGKILKCDLRLRRIDFILVTAIRGRAGGKCWNDS